MLAARAARCRALAAALAAFVVLGLLAAAAGPAAAQAGPGFAPGAAPSPGAPAEAGADLPRLVVEDLDATIRPGSGLSVIGRVDNPAAVALEGLRLRATLQRATTTRLGFQRAMDVDGAPTRAAVSTATVDVGSVPAGGSAPVQLTRTAAELGLGSVDDRVAGVYPLTLTLLDGGGDPLDEARTAAVALPELVGEPVRAALLVPVDSAVSVTVDGLADPDPLAGGLSGSAPLPRLAAGLAAGLAGAPDVPVTVASSGFALAAAADAADGYRAQDAGGEVDVGPEDLQARLAADLLADLRGVLARPAVEHVALPFADADLVALVRAGQADAARQAVGDGVLRASQVTGARPVPGVLWPPDALDEAALGALRAGLDSVVVGAASLDGPALGGVALSPSPVRRLRAPGEVTALVADPWLSPLLAGQAPGTPDLAASGTWPGGQDPALAAQRILAETAALYFESPFAAASRGLLLVPPRLWDADPAALSALLAGMADAPWLAPVTLPELAAQVPAAPAPNSLVYPEAARQRELSAEYLGEVAAARDAVRSLGTILTDPTGVGDADSLVRAATSVQFRERTDDGLALVRAVIRTAQVVFDGVEVIPGPTFTLTGDTTNTEIPVELVNNGPVAIDVAVTLAGLTEAQFAVEPAQRTVRLEPGVTTALSFSVDPLVPGSTAPMLVRVTGLGGQRELATQTMVVRSRSTSAAAIVLTAGAGGFLALWWSRDAARRRRARRAAAPRVRAPV